MHARAGGPLPPRRAVPAGALPGEVQGLRLSHSVLTLNAGSSSIKLAVYRATASGVALLLRGQAEGLGRSARLLLRNDQGQVLSDEALGAVGHEAALSSLLSSLRAQGLDGIAAVGHRVVHGGTRFEAPCIVDADALHGIEQLQSLAPLHQPHNLAGIRAAQAAFPKAVQVACFDTGFHRTMPEVRQRFALPEAWHQRGIRRYGFHGLSYESIAEQLQAAAPQLAAGRVVVAHLGNGASMCAMHGGRSVATTMSFSPLDGLPSGTRCGRLDAAAVLHLIKAEGLAPDRVLQLLSRESGWLGLSGQTSDMRQLLASPHPQARLAVQHLVDHILCELGSLAAAMQGLDALVFTGGIGENAAGLREEVMLGAAWLGLRWERSSQGAVPGCITRPESPVSAWVLRTDEEGVIARHTAALVAAHGCIR